MLYSDNFPFACLGIFCKWSRKLLLNNCSGSPIKQPIQSSFKHLCCVPSRSLRSSDQGLLHTFRLKTEDEHAFEVAVYSLPVFIVCYFHVYVDGFCDTLCDISAQARCYKRKVTYLPTYLISAQKHFSAQQRHCTLPTRHQIANEVSNQLVTCRVKRRVNIEDTSDGYKHNPK